MAREVMRLSLRDDTLGFFPVFAEACWNRAISAGALDALSGYVYRRRVARFLLEHAREVIRAQVRGRGELPEKDRIADMFGDES